MNIERLLAAVLVLLVGIQVLQEYHRQKQANFRRSRQSLLSLAQHALTEGIDFFDLFRTRPQPPRPITSWWSEFVAILHSQQMYVATVLLYSTRTREMVEIAFHYGRANTATDMYNLVVCPLYTPLTRATSINRQRDLMWHAPDVGCVVLVEQIYRTRIRRRISLSLSS